MVAGFRRIWLLVVAATLMAGVTAALSPVTPASAGSDLPSLPLRTSGNQIVAADGTPVILQGVNWFGMETATHAPHGLWSRDYRDMLAQIAGLGFNTIRLPFSLEALQSNSTNGIDYGSGRNKELQGRTPQQVMDAIITAAGDYGLMIILDNHSQADDGFMYDLWYGQNGFTETDWINTWKQLATRYRDTKNVIGFDLKNEPHGSATWGDGAATDWRRAAERAGNAALAIAPSKLIIVEGIEGPAPGQQLDRHWWGGNLEGAASHPVRLDIANRLVYSPHEYGPGVHDQPWFSDPNMADILTQRWDTGFGYLHDSNTAPILIGEFGAKNVGTDTTEGRWIRQFANYLADNGMHWTYWSWNPNSGDTGGILTDDWTTTHPDKVQLLQDLMDRKEIDYGADPSPSPPVTSSPTPTATASPSPDPPATASPSPTSSSPNGTPITATIQTDSQWDGGWCGKLTVTNTGSTTAQLDWLQLQLVAGSTVTSLWNGSSSRDGTQLTIELPAWAVAPVGGTYSDTGLCVTQTAPQDLTAIWHYQNGPTATAAPSPTQTTSPTPTPTATPTETPTPTSSPTSPASDLTVSWKLDSDWGAGYCRSSTITNNSASSVSDWRLTFELASATRISQSWNGNVSRADTRVSVTPPEWATKIGPGQSVSAFGYCAAGSDAPDNSHVTGG
jgi:endoglucanase